MMHPNYRKLTKEELELHELKSEQYGPQNLERWGPVYNIMRFINKAALIERALKQPSGRWITKRLSKRSSVTEFVWSVDLKKLREELLDIAIHAKIAICLIDDGFDLVPIRVERHEHGDSETSE